LQETPVLQESNAELQIRNPLPGSKIETGNVQSVEVYLTHNGAPVPGWPIEFFIKKGNSQSSQSDVTDEGGFARFTIQSDKTGEATITAKAGELEEPIKVEFIPRLETRHRYEVLVAEGKPRKEVKIKVRKKQLSVLLKQKTSPELELEIAKSAGLSFEGRLSSRLLLYSAPEPLSRNSQWSIARQLMSTFPDQIISAGLSARLKGTAQQLVVSDEIIMEFDDPQLSTFTVKNKLKFIPEAFDVTRCAFNDSKCFKLHLDRLSGYDVLETANLITSKLTDEVRYAQPNFYWFIDFRSKDCSPPGPWCDERYQWQWHLENTDFMGSQPDADADVREAWHFTQGKSGETSTLIAILDSSFYAEHEDFEGNLWQSDGVFGIRVVEDDHPGLLNPDTKNPSHGTKVAGIAAARGGNGIGGTGVCPECRLLLIRYSVDDTLASSENIETGFKEAWGHGAKIISNSWGGEIEDSLVYDAVKEAVEKGSVVLIAMSNEKLDNCGGDSGYLDISAHPDVIAVSGITDRDRRSKRKNQGGLGFGDCMDVLAPTRGGDWGIDTTTFKTDGATYRSDYSDNFGGTSAATPLVAGIAGLMITVDPSLSPLDIQRVLQDTADKVQPKTAEYDTETGFADPPGSAKKSRHGYGRVNAFEAVRLVAKEKGGKKNMDHFIRDHQWDWGNTEQDSDITFDSPRKKVRKLQSVDIKIKAVQENKLEESPPFEVSLQEFNDLKSEKIKPDRPYKIFVRVRNRGHTEVNDATLKVFWTVYNKEDDLPSLPDKIWKSEEVAFDEKDEWQPLTFMRNIDHLEYSGASVAGCPNRKVPQCLPSSDKPSDKARVFVFDVPAIQWRKKKERVAYLAIIDSDDDPVLARQQKIPDGFDSKSAYKSVVMDNNVTLWTTQ
jgi:hypothetical protein